jgi:ribose 5-phosphate isomerase B
MRISIVADHNGVAMKTGLVAWLERRGHEVEDLGAHDDTEVDYPPLCAELGRRVAEGLSDRGIVIGGSGHGEVIACNKVPGVRAGLLQTPFSIEISRGNNDSNVLVLGAKVISAEEAEQITEAWLSTPFKGGKHARRLEQIAALERELLHDRPKP